MFLNDTIAEYTYLQSGRASSSKIGLIVFLLLSAMNSKRRASVSRGRRIFSLSCLENPSLFPKASLASSAYFDFLPVSIMCSSRFTMIYLFNNNEEMIRIIPNFLFQALECRFPMPLTCHNSIQDVNESIFHI